jgi:GDP-4-dehydro-6-deoxy-D-mannose reductase
MRTALITGSAGFAGRHLIEQLGDRGVQVAGFDLTGGYDTRNYEQIRWAIDHHNPDLIFHLAGQAFVPESSTDPRRGLDVTVTGALNLLEAVRHTGSRARVLLAGTSAEYGASLHLGINISEETLPTPDNPYGVAKLAAGQLGLVYHRLYGIPVVVTRAFNHTGPGHPPVYAVPWFAKQIAEVEAGIRDHVAHGNLDAVRSYCDVRDIVAGYISVIDAAPGIYNIGGDTPISLAQVLKTLCALSQSTIEWRPDPALYRPGWQTGTPMHGPINLDKIHQAVGWRPQIPLEQTLTDTLNYWRRQVSG